MSCRLYSDEDGQLPGAPSVKQLRQAIEQALAVAAAPQDASLGEPGRNRGRVAPTERGLS